jgi:protein-tyrosine phosphatase
MTVPGVVMSETSTPVPPGRIDIHSHLLPGIDDGCQDLSESLECVRRLNQAGYVGTICTPHLWPDQYPEITPANIAVWTDQLARHIADAGLPHRLWPGAELRLFRDAIDWMNANGVPTLAGSRCVLADLWDDRWPRFADRVLDWLLDHHYQPILAHPERLPGGEIEPVVPSLLARGVWLQGNLRSLTGEEGYFADQLSRQFLSQGRYRLMGMDLHGLDGLEGRLDGLSLLEAEFGRETVEQLVTIAPRRLILGLS